MQDTNVFDKPLFGGQNAEKHIYVPQALGGRFVSILTVFFNRLGFPTMGLAMNRCAL